MSHLWSLCRSSSTAMSPLNSIYWTVCAKAPLIYRFPERLSKPFQKWIISHLNHYGFEQIYSAIHSVYLMTSNESLREWQFTSPLTQMFPVVSYVVRSNYSNESKFSIAVIFERSFIAIGEIFSGILQSYFMLSTWKKNCFLIPLTFNYCQRCIFTTSIYRVIRASNGYQSRCINSHSILMSCIMVGGWSETIIWVPVNNFIV